MNKLFSKFGELNQNDLIKGLIMAIIGAILPIIQQSIESGNLTFDWNAIWKMALSVALAYLTKQLFTNSNNQPLQGEK